MKTFRLAFLLYVALLATALGNTELSHNPTVDNNITVIAHKGGGGGGGGGHGNGGHGSSGHGNGGAVVAGGGVAGGAGAGGKKSDAGSSSEKISAWFVVMVIAMTVFVV